MVQKKKGLTLTGLSIFTALVCTGAISESLGGLLKGHGLGERVVVFILSMLPISELRGAIPVGVHVFNLPWLETSLIALAGNILPVIPILFLLDAIIRLLGRIKLFRRFFDWLISLANKRGGLIERYEYMGLFLFVAIPLPITGAWTGTLIATVLRMHPWRSFFTISLGVITADLIVTSLTILGWWGLLVAVIILPLLWLMSKWLEKRGKPTTDDPKNHSSNNKTTHPIKGSKSTDDFRNGADET
jgi:uncharacterized membrane protein